MTGSAYILIQTEVGKAAQDAQEVASIDGVVAAEEVTGPYDVIARAESNTVAELGKMVVSEVQMIEGITRTITCPVVNIRGFVAEAELRQLPCTERPSGPPW